MTLQQFIDKWKGKGIDFDGSFGFQCVDAARMYCREVLNVFLSPPVPGAKDIWDKFNQNAFIQIANSPTGIPQKGDLIIWDGKVGGGAGHIAIFQEGDAGQFKSWDQNWPAGTLFHLVNHKYTNVLGWLRFRDDIIKEDMIPNWLRTMFLERNIDLEEPEQEIRSKVQEIFDDAKGATTLEKRVSKLEKDLAEARGDSAKWEELYVATDKQVKTISERLDEARRGISQRDSEIGKLSGQVATFNQEVKLLKEDIKKLKEGGDSNMATKKLGYPAAKKALWEGFRVFVPVFLTTLGAQFQLGVNLEDWQTWARSTLAAALVAGIKAVIKWLRETYSKGDYQSLLYKLPF